MKIGIFGCGYRPDKLPLLQRLFEKLNRLDAEIFVSKDFHAFLTTTPHFCPPISGVLTVVPLDGKTSPSWALTPGASDF